MASGGIFQAIGGTTGCRRLAEAFYKRVGQDPVLRPFFPGKTHRCAIEAFSAFLVQFLGGPPENTQHRWWLSLRESHLRFEIGARERDAWMNLMIQALDEARIDEPARAALLGFFDRSSAYVANQGPASSDAHLNAEMADRWDTQLALDEAVAAVRCGDAGDAMTRAEAIRCEPAVFAGLLAQMIASGDAAMLAYAEKKLRADPALVTARYAGRTLLHTAAGSGCLQIVKTLLQLGADPNTEDGGRHTPLYSVGNECVRGGGNVVRALVQAGANVNACAGVKRCTALHMAARRGNTEVAAALLDCGANLNARDSQGVTPLRRALNCRKAEVAALLRDQSPA